MSQPFVGEIRMFAGNFAPSGWEFCDGRLMPIWEYDVLFNLIGTTYGGDGQTTFALPDLASRVPLHAGTFAGNTYLLGQKAGVEEVTLTTPQLPAHQHAMLASSATGTAHSAAGNVVATAPNGRRFTTAAPDVNLRADAVLATGGSQPHTNLQPHVALSFIISLFGIFPTQN